MDMYPAIPVLATNLDTDIRAASGTKPAYEDRKHTPLTNESQAVTIGQSRALGAFNNMQMPGLMIWMIKGRDYFAGQTKTDVEGGHYKKKVAYKPVPLPA